MVIEINIISPCTSTTRHLVMKHDLLSFSFAMDDMYEIFLRVLDSCFCFGITSPLARSRTKI